MDYEVFILARMREEYERTGSTNEAVVRGIASTGRLVTSAALIVFLAFASMATADDLDVKVLATGSLPACCSTPSSCARCSCRRRSRGWVDGTGGCRSRSGACCSPAAPPRPALERT